MPAPATGTPQLARTWERRHRTARVRTSTGGCARRIPGPTPRDGSSSLPTSTKHGAWSPTSPFAVERELEDLAALIDHAGAPVFVYGHSAGAALALRAAGGGLPIAKLV